MKHFTSIKALAIVAALTSATLAYAGDGTKENPYTVAELNAQKDALAASGNVVWVKANLKGLGKDGTLQENADNDQMAGLFGDATGDFVAYSYQILNGLAMSDLTNTNDLLISLTYGTSAHLYGNTANPQYASNYEEKVVTDAHFSLEEVHGALSLNINGYRGYHIASQYVLPEGVKAIKTTASFTNANGASMAYPEKTSADGYISIKNVCVVFVAPQGTYDFVLTAALHIQWNGGNLSGGTNAELNTISNKNYYLYRFINENGKVGFERNTDGVDNVWLASKDEVYLTVSSDPAKFMGSWQFSDGDAKKWIAWAGPTPEASAIQTLNRESFTVNRYFDLQGRQISQPTKGLYINNGKKYIAK